MKRGNRLGPYEIQEQLGAGGMGEVWLAKDTRLGRKVAIKVLPEPFAADPERLARFEQEARAAAILNHPGICSIHDIGDWDGRPFIVMERLVGRSLSDHIGPVPLDVNEAIDVTIQIADALAAAHAGGIVHRDIKPANIFLVEDGSSRRRAKLLDFGVARLAADLPDTVATAAATRADMTAPGTVMGTASYMSPEQALGKPVDARTDIFSLGVVLYEMLTARRAFEGSTSAAIFDSILNRVPPPPRAMNDRVPEALERIVRKALEKEPRLRYQSAADLGADLRRVRRDASAARSPMSRAGGGRRPGWGTWVGVAALAVVVGLLAAETTGWLRTGGIAAPSGSAASAPNGRIGGPSIMVMPFESLGTAAGRESFADGLTMDIVTELSHYRELSVMAGSGESVPDARPMDVRVIGERFAARYVLQGSVRQDAQLIRVSVRLSDTEDGRLVWGTTYERDLTARGLFALQDDLTQQVVTAIAGSYGALTRAGLPDARRKAPMSLDSYDCVLRVYEYLQVHTNTNHLAARECLEAVVGTDTDYADGRAWLGYLYAEEYHHRRNERVRDRDVLDLALEMAEGAVSLDTANHVAHGALALSLFFRGDYARAKSEAYLTIELAPNDALWLLMMGTYLAQQEDFDGGIPMVRRSIALNPSSPPWAPMALFFEHYQRGRYEEALAVAIQIENGLGDDYRGPLFVAATYGQLGRPEDAAARLDEMLAAWRRPAGEIRAEFVERDALGEGLADGLLDGLAKAGLNLSPE